MGLKDGEGMMEEESWPREHFRELTEEEVRERFGYPEGELSEAANRIMALEAALWRTHLAFKKALDSGLTRRAVVVLVKDQDPSLRLGDIDRVLDALGSLDRYLEREEDPDA